MKAVVKERPGVGAAFREAGIPAFGSDEVLVRVRATSICGTDVHIYNWDHWSAQRIGEKRLPQILGHEVAGEVVETGPHVERIKVGDYISAETHIYDPGDLQALLGRRHIGERMQILGVDRDGCFAEYIAVPERVCWINDPTIPPEFASVQEPLGNATYAVLGEDNDVAGKSMAIIGDGPVALFSVGVARLCGATKIFLVGMNGHALRIAERMGADHLINVGECSFEERLEQVRDLTGGYGVDIVVDMAGNQQAIDEGIAYIRRGGRFTAFGLSPDGRISFDYNEGIVFKGVQIHGINGRRIFDTWYRVRNFLSSRRLDISPVITHMFTLEQFEEGFHLMLAQPRASAKVVLFPDPAELEAARRRRGI